MISFVFTQASLPSSPCGSSSLGPSGAFSYAVGFVPHILQLQGKHRGFRWKLRISTPKEATGDGAFHNEAEPKPHPLHYRSVRQWRQKVRSNLKGAA